jgi:hypothetical protein
MGLQIFATWETLAYTWVPWLVPIVHSAAQWWYQWVVVPFEFIRLRFS